MIDENEIIIAFLAAIFASLVLVLITFFLVSYSLDKGRAEVFTGEAVCEYVSDKVFCAKKVGE